MTGTWGRQEAPAHVKMKKMSRPRHRLRASSETPMNSEQPMLKGKWIAAERYSSVKGSSVP